MACLQAPQVECSINTRMLLIHPRQPDFTSCPQFCVIHQRLFIIYIIISVFTTDVTKYSNGKLFFLDLYSRSQAKYLRHFPPKQGQSAVSATKRLRSHLLRIHCLAEGCFRKDMCLLSRWLEPRSSS